MNVENLTKIRNEIAAENGDVTFNMGMWRGYLWDDAGNEPCGTAACIGGWTEILIAEERGEDIKTVHILEQEVADWLGLSLEVADDLFFGFDTSDDITKDLAVKVLDDIIETGSFKGWHYFIEEAREDIMNDEA